MEPTNTKNIDKNEVMALGVDTARSLCKVEFDGNDVLHVMLISLAGPNCQPSWSAYVSDESKNKRGVVTLKYHIEPDIVTYQDVMKKKIKAERERMTQIMFETDNVLDMYMVIQAVLSLFALIRMTDLVMTLPMMCCSQFPPT